MKITMGNISFRKAGIRSQVILILAVVLIPVFILQLRSAFELRTHLLQDAKVHSQLLAQKIAEDQEFFSQSSMLILQELSRFPDINPEKGKELYEGLFELTNRLTPQFSTIIVLDPKGDSFLSSTDDKRVFNYADRDFYKSVMATEDPSIGSYAIGKRSNKPLIAYAVPSFKPGTSNIQSIIVGSMNLDWIAKVVDGSKLPEGSTVTIFDTSGTILVRFPEDIDSVTTVGSIIPENSDFRKAFKADSGSFISRGLDSIKRHYEFNNIGSKYGNIRVLVGMPLSSIFTKANKSLFFNVLLLFFLSLFAFSFAFQIAISSFITRITKLMNNIDEIEKGSRTLAVTDSTDTSELGQLSIAFSRMTANLFEKEDALNRSNKELEQFAYIASHDLQEPLRMVTSYLQLIERRYGNTLETDAKEFFAFAIDGAKRMKQLIEDLLSFSRVTTSGGEFTNCSVSEILNTVCKNISTIVEETQTTIEYENLPFVYADSGQVAQLFQNIIINAIKYRSSEPPVIKIKVEQINEFWKFSITDNGIGIEKQHFERVFEIFQRLHSREHYSGTGIGLAICKRIVERQGGTIGLESEPEKGSTFYFTLPVST